MVDAETFLQMGRDVIASQPFSVLLGADICQCEVVAVSAGEEKLCAIAQGTIAKLADKDGTNP